MSSLPDGVAPGTDAAQTDEKSGANLAMEPSQVEERAAIVAHLRRTAAELHYADGAWLLAAASDIEAWEPPAGPGGCVMSAIPWTADLWNERYPLGTKVDYFPVAGWPQHDRTATRSEAWGSASGEVVVKVEGHAGGVSVRHLLVVP